MIRDLVYKARLVLTSFSNIGIGKAIDEVTKPPMNYGDLLDGGSGCDHRTVKF
jgi:hypothetical protein